MLHLVRVKSLIDEEGRAYMGNALVTAVYALLSLPSRLPLCCKQGCRQIRLTIRYINQINQFKYNVCTSDISEWRAATLEPPDHLYVPAPERVALPETLQCYRGQRS